MSGRADAPDRSRGRLVAGPAGTAPQPRTKGAKSEGVHVGQKGHPGANVLLSAGSRTGLRNRVRVGSCAMSDLADGPLADLRVIDLSTVLAGPGCARYLGDFGADVIKVERPDGGDTLRHMGWLDPADDVS